MANALPMKEVHALTKDKKAVRLHGDCYTLWTDERRRAEVVASIAFTLCSSTPPTRPAASRAAAVAAHHLQLRGNSPLYFRTLPCRACLWPLTVIAVMAGLLLIVSTTEPGRYVYLKYGVARKNSDVILDRRKEDRRRIHQAASTPERRYGDRRHRDITRELEAFGWAVAHR
jgi:hypothetical protein